MKDIINYNNKGQLHGYYYNTNIGFRGNYKNNNLIGYVELDFIKCTRYYIK